MRMKGRRAVGRDWIPLTRLFAVEGKEAREGRRTRTTERVAKRLDWMERTREESKLETRGEEGRGQRGDEMRRGRKREERNEPWVKDGRRSGKDASVVDEAEQKTFSKWREWIRQMDRNGERLKSELTR